MEDEDDEEEEDDAENFQFPDEQEIPHLDGPKGWGNPVWIKRRRPPATITPGDSSLNPDGFQPVERFKDWDFINGNFIDGYEIEEDKTTTSYVEHIPAGYETDDGDAVYWDFEKNQPYPPEVIKKMRAEDPDWLDYDEEKEQVIREMMLEDEMRLEQRRFLKDMSPSVDVVSLIEECLAPFNPLKLEVTDITSPYLFDKQKEFKIHIQSKEFEGMPMMKRQIIAEKHLKPVYDTGVKFIHTYYQAPSEEYRNIVSWITRYNISNNYGIQINSTGVAWKIYQPSELKAPITDELYEEDEFEDEEPQQFVANVTGLRSIPWYGPDYEIPEHAGRLREPYTESIAYYAKVAQQEREARRQAEDKDRGLFG
eukprot:CAMPEP_0167742542 /NCGR_PEP_ID=MMETSP0110_2-20121227/1494_1 /TAXON_ID=629695 /ORGANISM="Gymnochlora sp., Strain CCMP2014" /LENGTH=366 /DNA_ID=CAMNT_0007626765 /DNA_START=74 /DNA_END=1171 /DNA_ORIENTATION=-